MTGDCRSSVGRHSALAILLFATACVSATTTDSKPVEEVSPAALVAQLASPRVNTRIDAARGLGRLGALAEEAVPDLILASMARDSELQAAIATALGHIGDGAPETVATLRGLADDDVEFVRDAALEGLVELGSAPTNGNVVAAVP